jgi:predicted DCC family thiol-disulfide oxidoreductase YuxK
MKTDSIILFDGVCNFCNSTVNFVLKQDKKNILLFAPLQSEAAQKILEQYQLSKSNFDSFVFVDGDKIYIKSSAALKVMGKLSWYWKWTQVFWIVPKPLRDWVYNFVSKNRYKWFGKKEQCMIPKQEVRKRFL